MKIKRTEFSIKGLILFLSFQFILGNLAGCSAPDSKVEKPNVPPGGVLLRGAGATFPSLLYKRWFELYHKTHPETVIVYDVVGSGEGIRRFMGKNLKPGEEVEFGASDAAMKDEDMAQVSRGVILLPMTAGSVVLAYNIPEFQGELKLSRKALAGIFLGEITKWNDPLIVKSNPGKKLPKLSIATVVRQDSSGTTFAFTKHLDAISDTWRSRFGPATLVNWPGNAMRAKGNEGVAARIQQSFGSIGYVGLEFARKLGLRLAVIENKEGRFIKPTEEACKAALVGAELPENLRAFFPDPSGPESYPIVTFSWILLYKNKWDPDTAKAVRDLFRWCLLDGQKEASALGYVPLTPNVADKSLAALATIVSDNRP